MAIEFQSAFLKRADAWLGQRRGRVILVLVLSASLFRVVYFFQLNDSPCIVQYRWRQSDMYFFDFWASKIAAGDWVGDEPLHPMLPWMQHISQTAMGADPSLKESINAEAATIPNQDLDRFFYVEKAKLNDAQVQRLLFNVLLWNRWVGGKAFPQ